MAEIVGFEPTDHFNMIDGLANRCLKPLSHISIFGAGGQFSLSLTHGTSVYLGRFPRITGGSGGIRTHGTLRYDGFQDRCLKPLSHTSILKHTSLFLVAAAEQHRNVLQYGS